ncbi:MAG: GH3 auxin-responsive promoter family protein [Myxococcaceae bacterium]
MFHRARRRGVRRAHHEDLSLSTRLGVVALNAAWGASRLRAARRFERAAKDPENAQLRLLQEFVEQHAGTRFGREHRLGEVRSVADFRSRVPIATWDSLAPWVERIADGERDVLSRDPVLVLERTSGGVRGPKLIPYTRRFLSQFGEATAPWLHDLGVHFPRLFMTRQYWSVSPVARASERTKGGLRVGLEDDSEYFDAATRFALKRLFAVDGAVAREPSVEAWREKTLTQLLAGDDLGFFSVWNPSFLTLLMEALERDWPRWRASLSGERARAIDRRLEREGRLTGEALWPSLQLISCWTDAWAAHAVPGLRRFFPRTPFQGKGLLATEGVVSFPLWGVPAPVAAVTSHFLEFASLDSARVYGAHELVTGARYAPLLTTANGFARYRLPDVVRCDGHWHRAPLLTFEGRLDRTSDLRGEKLESAFVEAALASVRTAFKCAFAFVAPAPTPEPPRYVLFVEGAEHPKEMAEALEVALREQPHYAYARDLGQLGPLEVRTVQRGDEKRLAALNARGVRLGDVKPAGFDPTPGWTEWLS